MTDAAYEAMSKAKRQAESGNPQGAVDTLEAYLATDPHNTKPRLLLADIIIHKLEDMKYGMMQLDIILDLEPDNTDALKALITVLSKDKKNNKETDERFRQDFTKSQEYYEKAIALDPSKYEYHLNYSVLLLNDIKDYPKAKEELEILLGMKPNDALVKKNYDKLMREKFDKDGNPKKTLSGMFRRK